ncbi:MAG: tRNA-dihydrouridine synthase [bacterium]
MDYKSLPKPFYILAPMDDVTDVVFRRIVTECAEPDLFFTEFVNVDGLQSAGRDRVLNKLRKLASEQATVAQVWGKNPENYYKTAKELVQMGFVGVDINMGCPEKSIVGNGCCSAFILPENRSLASQVIEAVQSAVEGKIPVSVKTRLGFNEVDYSWHEHLLKHNLNMLTVHARTRKEMSKVPADWSKLEPIVKLRNQLSPSTLIVGNGDVTSRKQGFELATKHNIDGVMIGRGIFTDPFVFAKDSPWQDYSKEQKIELLKRHVELFDKTWMPGERNFDMLKKFAKVYINGFDGASDMRVHIMECKSAQELLEHIKTLQ